MISYKASYTKADLYELLSKYQKRLQKKVEQIANKVINMSNVEVFHKEDLKRSCSINPEKDKNARSTSMIESAHRQQKGIIIPKHKMIANIEQKIGEYHLPKIGKGDTSKIKQLQKDITNKPKQKIGRSIGRNKYVKPKFPSKKPFILPKQIRNNPFTQPRPVPVSDLKHGLLNLMNKGIINRDVDISVAFQWGDAPFQSKGAVIHSYDQVLIQEELDESKMLKHRREEMMPSFPSTIKNVSVLVQQKEQERNEWALTGLDTPLLNLKKVDEINSKQTKLLFSEITHLQFKNYTLKNNTHQFIQFRKRNIQIWGLVVQTLKFIQSYLKKFSITLAFVDGRKLIFHSYSLYKLNDKQINDCIVGSLSDKRKLQGLKRIPNGPVKNKIAVEMVMKLLKANVIRNQYQKTQLIKDSKLRIARWIDSVLERRKTRSKISQNIQLRNKHIHDIQSQFQLSYQTIMSSPKYYQVHIPSQSQPISPTKFHQQLNTQITRIFHLKPNINIIYVSPISMSEETINYYYKILELGEVENFKQRVKFVECDRSQYFDGESLNKRLYYSSKTIREIKQLTKGTQSVLVPGQLQQPFWYLVSSLSIPSLSNYRSYNYSLHSTPLHLFRTLDVPSSTFFKIDPTPTGEFYLNQLVRKLTNFASDNRFKMLMVRVDNDREAVVTVKCPVRNFEDLVDKTMILKGEERYGDAGGFYRQVMRVGGVAEKYDTGFRYLRSLVEVKPNKKISIFGTFQKILTQDHTVVAVAFPQQVTDNQVLSQSIQTLTDGLIKDLKYYGYLEIDFLIDKSQVLLSSIHWGLSPLCSSIFYFEYLANAKQTAKGHYESQIIQSQLSLTISQHRSYVYSPYILHFGLNQFQLKNFFQLCRAEGISFDLERKYGSAFALLEGVRNAVGVLATAKSTKIALGLLIQAVGFIYRQTVKNVSEDREERIRDKRNIVAVKSKLQECYNRGVYD